MAWVRDDGIVVRENEFPPVVILRAATQVPT